MILENCWIGYLVAFSVVVSPSSSLPQLRHTNESDFTVVAQMPTFIDKTLFLKYAHQQGTKVYLAPSGFGKSTNLDMMRKFFQAEVTKDGEVLTQQLTQYYRLFKNMNIWKYSSSFMKKHQGQYPVLWIDLKLFNTGHPFDHTLKNLTQELFMDHSYLSNSLQLSEPDRISFEKMYVRVLSPTAPFDRDDVIILVRLLREHYGRQVIVFVDDIDGVGGAGNSENSGKESRDLKTLGKFLGGILKNNQDVFYSVSTGVTKSCDTVGAYVNNLDYVSIFDNEKVAKFYGFTFDDILEKANALERTSLVQGIKDMYKGHTVDDSKMTVYNTQAIVKCLSTGRV